MIEVEDNDPRHNQSLPPKGVWLLYYDTLCKRYGGKCAQTFCYGVRVTNERFSEAAASYKPSDWITAHLGLRHEIGFIDLGIYQRSDRYTMAYFFKDEDHAFEFKMVWG